MWSSKTLFKSSCYSPEEGLKELFKFDKLIWDTLSGLFYAESTLSLKVELTNVIDPERV
jgi:hypothetical protein